MLVVAAAERHLQCSYWILALKLVAVIVLELKVAGYGSVEGCLVVVLAEHVVVNFVVADAVSDY